jgi:hypothetical protein
MTSRGHRLFATNAQRSTFQAKRVFEHHDRFVQWSHFAALNPGDRGFVDATLLGKLRECQPALYSSPF